jgi:hypothetical protein
MRPGNCVRNSGLLKRTKRPCLAVAIRYAQAEGIFTVERTHAVAE